MVQDIFIKLTEMTEITEIRQTKVLISNRNIDTIDLNAKSVCSTEFSFQVLNQRIKGKWPHTK